MHVEGLSPENARAALLEDIGRLPDDELLALAYSFSHSEARLRVYLELFRQRSGERAQFAACLICFDLAQRGDVAMAAQFAYLRGTLWQLGQTPDMAAHLVGDHAYLCALWQRCSQALADLEGPASHDAPGVAEAYGILRAADAPLAGALDLLTDDDLSAEALQVDEEAMWQSYVRACEQFFGNGTSQASYDGSMGFRLRGHHGQARAQAFSMALEQGEQFVPPAKGMRPLLLLTWGLSLKPRGLLGQPNKRRQHLLCAGLWAFLEAGPQVAQVAEVMGPLYAEPDAWPQIAALLGQYQQFVAARPQGAMAPQKAIESFVTEVMAH